MNEPERCDVCNMPLGECLCTELDDDDALVVDDDSVEMELDEEVDDRTFEI